MSAAFWTRVRRRLTTERHLLGCALVRLGAGLVALSYLVGHWSARELLWGSGAVYPLSLYRRDLSLLRWPSLFAVESDVAFTALYVAAIAVVGLYTIGWQTRWLGLPFYVVVSSLLARNPMLLTGGDALFLAELPFLVFLDTGAYLSVDSGWRRPGERFEPPSRPFAALLHNVALIGIAIQLCMAYEVSGLYKVAGELWRNGTAVYYALRRPEFVLPGVSAAIYRPASVVTLLTYGTVAFEIAYPFLVWKRGTRWLAVLIATLFHGAIAVVMGLVTFAAEMLVFQLVLLDDEQYRRAYGWLVRADERRR